MKKVNHDEWLELTQIMNDYMIRKEWDVVEALNFIKGVLVKSAVISGVSKRKFDLQCEAMKEMFLEMENKNISEILYCDMENPLVKEFHDTLKKMKSANQNLAV